MIQQRNVGVHSLRDVSMKMLETEKPHLGEEIFLRCFYVVKEIERTQKAAACLKANDFKGFGRLMYQTHWGLSKDYGVSCEESDWLVSFAEENGVIGARQMGGGFGGCTINVIQKEKKIDFIEKVRGKYFAVFKKEPDFYSVKISAGVHPAQLE